MPERLGEAWCSYHDCHPKECFETHHPEAVAYRDRKHLTPKQQRKVIRKLHKRYQKEGMPDAEHRS